jgi:aryl-alcohol dehydrogenase-like predicted oxidoreductase
MSYGEPERLPQPWSLDEKASRPLIRQALEAGINFFDTANIYSGGSSEEITGKALKEMARRDEIVVATKTFFPWRNSPNTGFLSRKAIFQSIDDSLMRLGMDYVDLFQIHRFDHSTPVEETMETLHDLVKSGKVRYIGASSMEAWRFAKCSILQSVTAGPDLLRCNRNTTCFTGKKSARCCPCVKTRALE